MGNLGTLGGTLDNSEDPSICLSEVLVLMIVQTCPNYMMADISDSFSAEMLPTICLIDILLQRIWIGN